MGDLLYLPYDRIKSHAAQAMTPRESLNELRIKVDDLGLSLVKLDARLRELQTWGDHRWVRDFCIDSPLLTLLKMILLL